MTASSQILFLLLALAAEILGTVGGFGSSVYFVPIASFFMDFQGALGLTALYHLGSNLSKMALFRQGIQVKLLLWMGIPSVLLVAAGGYLAAFLKGSLLEALLGAFLVGMSLVFLIWPSFHFSPTRKNAMWGGALSGFSAGLMGTGGAIRGLTMAAFNLEKSTFIATSASIDMAIDLTRSVVYFGNGFITTATLVQLPFLLVIAWIGTWLGKKLVERIPQNRFRALSLGLILAIGTLVLLKGIADSL